jgi:hypothetical protein
MAQKGLGEPRVAYSKMDYRETHFALVHDGTVDKNTMEYFRAFVGGLHRLRNETHAVPNVHLFTTRPLDLTFQEEVSMWTKVELQSLQQALALPLLNPTEETALTPEQLEYVKYAVLELVAKEAGHCIWVQDGFLFDPAHQSLAEAEKTEDSFLIKEAIDKGQVLLMIMVRYMEAQGYIKVVYQKEALAEGYMYNHPAFKMVESKLACFYGLPSGCSGVQEDGMKDQNGDAVKTLGNDVCGLYRFNPKSDLYCNLDIKPEPILNVLLTKEVAITQATDKYTQMSLSKDVKRMAIAMPTTSKGLANSTEPVFFKDTIATMLETVTTDELAKFLITIYIGYDHGDPLFEDEKERAAMIRKLQTMIGARPAVVKFIRFPKTGRVGMLWSMLFFRAMKEGADYFYQVNDDLRMVTKGWLTKFTGALDANGGFGVVGPADNHNGFNCSILTQAMVTRTHFDIFTMFYPTELKDWKTDRWLSHVYGPDHTFCWTDYIANNGGSKTRYAHCPFLSWKIYLEAGKEKIAKWVQQSGFKATTRSP